MAKYYELLLAVLKVVAAVVLSQGPQNDQTISQARHFLEEYRSSIVAIFKRCAGIGNASNSNRDVLEALVDSFTVLISAAGFLDVKYPESHRMYLADFNSAKQKHRHANQGIKYFYKSRRSR